MQIPKPSFKKHSWKKFFKLTFARKIFIYYISFILIGTIFLTTSITWKTEHTHVNFINALYDASSAFSDTGLSNFASTFDTYNGFGQFIIFSLILIGGLGFNAIKLIFFFFIGRKLGMIDKLFMGYEKGIDKVNTTRDIILCSVIVTLVCEIVFGFGFGLYFNFSNSFVSEINFFLRNHHGSSYIDPNNLHNHFGLSLWYGLFHANSAINNAGFDIFGSNSLSPFVGDYFVQFMFIILIIIGGIGFPIYYELYRKFLAYRRNEVFKFSLFTKITVCTYFLIMILSTGLIVLLEYTAVADTSLSSNPPIYKNHDYNNFERFMICYFTETSSRSAGFSTINIQDFNASSKLIYLANMWIGASPSSTGGGIRTTTIGVIVIASWTFIRGKKELVAFKRNISMEVVWRSTVVFVVALALILVASLFLIPSLPGLNNASNPRYTYTLVDTLFECASAFGTTGLSTGISSSGQLSIMAKIVLIFLMIIGQLTISSTLLLGLHKNKSNTTKIYFPTENIAVG